ncbi:NucA/NucB deoxyribonuclease domain-containing protein [Actinomadura napierensis]|uniref:Deoxyribonuclease NucA/NucB domain-containing protein n=1 Tax=Actinomadura napierensis TaxID=267854 RepID=A0ABP5LKG1_9ACTN
MKALKSIIAILITLIITAVPSAAMAQQPSGSPGKDAGNVLSTKRESCQPNPTDGGKTTWCIKEEKGNPQELHKKFAEARNKKELSAQKVTPPEVPDCPVTITQSTIPMSRLSICSAKIYNVFVYIDNDPRKIVGTQKFYNWQWIYYQWNATQWHHESLTAADAGKDELSGGSYMSMRSLCSIFSERCQTARSNPTEAFPWLFTGTQKVIYDWQEKLIQDPLPGYEYATALGGYLGMELSSSTPGSEPPTQTIIDNGSLDGFGQNLDGRCDNADTAPSEGHPDGTINRGCVDQVFTPLLEYDARPDHNPLVQEVAKHIYDRQKGDPSATPVADGAPTPTNKTLPTRWGVGTIGRPLHRTQDESRITANRNTACPAGRPVSCDEWPMASTREGAANPEPPVDGQDWSWRTVPRAANDSQGGLTGDFYNKNRVLDGDAFWLRAILNDGRASW